MDEPGITGPADKRILVAVRFQCISYYIVTATPYDKYIYDCLHIKVEIPSRMNTAHMTLTDFHETWQVFLAL
jgi:hypothetical protein